MTANPVLSSLVMCMFGERPEGRSDEMISRMLSAMALESFKRCPPGKRIRFGQMICSLANAIRSGDDEDEEEEFDVDCNDDEDADVESFGINALRYSK